jgi:hypothetical protein
MIFTRKQQYATLPTGDSLRQMNELTAWNQKVRNAWQMYEWRKADAQEANNTYYQQLMGI